MELFTGPMQKMVNEIHMAEDERKEAIHLISEEAYAFRDEFYKFMKRVQDFVHELQIENLEHARTKREKLAFDEKARLETARLVMEDARLNLKTAFDLARAEREFAVKSRLDDIRKELAHIHTEIANGHQVLPKRNSNGNGKHAKKSFLG
jgi:hypothetical protein